MGKVLVAVMTGVLVLLFSPRVAPEDDPGGGSAAPHEMVLLYSSNLEGEIEPCGCTEGMLGGLARRSMVFARERARAPGVLALDAGDVFFRREAIPDVLRPQLAAKAEAIARLYAALHYDAVARGELDLVLGEDLYGRLVRDQALPSPTLGAPMGPRGASLSWDSSLPQDPLWHAVADALPRPTCPTTADTLSSPMRRRSRMWGVFQHSAEGTVVDPSGRRTPCEHARFARSAIVEKTDGSAERNPAGLPVTPASPLHHVEWTVWSLRWPPFLATSWPTSPSSSPRAVYCA